MAVNNADYEPAAEGAQPAAGNALGQRPADTIAADSGTALDLNPLISSANAASAAMAELVSQTKELCRWTTSQIAAYREMASVSSANDGQSKEEPAVEPGQEGRINLPDDHATEARNSDGPGVEPGSPAENAAGESDDDPADCSAAAPVTGESAQRPPEEQSENAAGVALPGAARDYKNKIDAARGRVGNTLQDTDELQALLDQAVTLLESISQHPSIQDYGANKRKLDEIEQRLGYGAYPQ